MNEISAEKIEEINAMSLEELERAELDTLGMISNETVFAKGSVDEEYDMHFENIERLKDELGFIQERKQQLRGE